MANHTMFSELLDTRRRVCGAASFTSQELPSDSAPTVLIKRQEKVSTPRMALHKLERHAIGEFSCRRRR